MGYRFYLHRNVLFNISTPEENEMKRIEYIEIEQMDEFKLLYLLLEEQRQYRQDNVIYNKHEGRIKQENFAYLVVKGNLEKGFYRK